MASFCAVQLTDSHFRADANAEMAGTGIDAAFEKILDQLEQQGVAPDLVLLTGDLADDPDPDVYPAIYQRLIQLVRRRFGSGVKICAVAGNHDITASFDSSFAQANIQTSGSFTIGNWRFCLLDSSVPRSNGGSISAAQLDELGTLAAGNPDQHLAVVLHHPPISLNSSWLDTMMVDNADTLFAKIAGSDNVKACIWGHAHQEWDSMFQGVRQLGAPATCPIQFKPHATEYTVHEQQTPGCRCVTFHPDGRFDTQVVRLESQEI